MAQKHQQRIPQKNIPATLPIIPEADPIATARRWYRRLVMALALIALMTYGNTQQNGFALDDMRILKNKLVTKGISAIPQLAVTPYHYGYEHNRNDLYRPLSLIVFAVERQFFGENAAVGHAINILLFAGCVLLLFVFLRRLLGRERTMLAFVASVLFAVHPIHTEVVANIKSQDELLCFLFGFLSMLQCLRYYDNGKNMQLAAAALCFILSLAAKETSITLMAIVPVMLFCFRSIRTRRALWILAALAMVCTAYLTLRFSVLQAYDANHTSELLPMDNALVRMPAGTSRIATGIALLGMYFAKLIWPNPLICDYSLMAVPYAGFTSIIFIFSAAFYLLVVGYAIYRLVKRKDDVLAFSIVFYVTTLMLFSNILMMIGTAFAERFLFYPSVGFCIAVAWGLEQGIGRKQVRWAAIGVIAFLMATVAIGRNKDWQDNYTLFTTDVAKAPDNARLRWYRGNELAGPVATNASSQEEHNAAVNESIRELQAAISIFPECYAAHVDLGYAFMLAGQLDSSEVHSNIGLEGIPENSIALSNLAGISHRKGDYAAAVAYSRRAKAVDTGNIDIAGNMALAFEQMKVYDSAIKYFKAVLDKRPDDANIIRFLARTFHKAGQEDSALRYIERHKRLR